MGLGTRAQTITIRTKCREKAAGERTLTLTLRKARGLDDGKKDKRRKSSSSRHNPVLEKGVMIKKAFPACHTEKKQVQTYNGGAALGQKRENTGSPWS